MKQITIVAGARPNFMKIAPIIHAIQKAIEDGHRLNYRLVHTGQHFDDNMSGKFFEELDIPQPDANLECGGGTQAEQTANIMVKFEQELLQNPTDLVIVVGDVTSTMACTITAKKLCIQVAHVEAGIRSGDVTMPEEINRMVTDAITDYFFTTSEIANSNLKKAGVPGDNIFFVGNTMIDTLLKNKNRFRKPAVYDQLKLEKGDYIVLTLHRPNNVDGEQKLSKTLEEIVNNAHGIPLLFPVHPRTLKTLEGLSLNATNLHLMQPLGYLEFNYLVSNCQAVITDSGGITEEATVLGIPCITLRDTTERPETVTIGTNELVGTGTSGIRPAMEKLFRSEWKKGQIPYLWDGKAAERIVQTIAKI